jgi:anti-sigma regulatory factor (Ser/Thr protein kinase)
MPTASPLGTELRTPQQQQGCAPLTCRLEFCATPSAVPCARSLARQIVLEWGRAELADTAELLVSELVTNAIQASASLPAPVVRLWLVAERDSIVIRVWDASPGMPRHREADPESEHGWGLVLVASLSKQWGTCRKPTGKVVWVQI